MIRKNGWFRLIMTSILLSSCTKAEEILYLQKTYNNELTSQILTNGREVIKWIKQQF